MSSLTIKGGYFETALFNQIFDSYQRTVLKNLIKHYTLYTAKGSSVYRKLSDMPYHVHILNGLYPSALLLEEILRRNGFEEALTGNSSLSEKLERYLKSFILGFTLHDINKLTGIQNLKQAVEQGFEEVCQKLETDEFFSDWREYRNEIKFVILKTEERTKNYGIVFDVKDRAFFNDYISEFSQLADKLSSFDDEPTPHRLYTYLQEIPFKGHSLLKDFFPKQWTLSYVYIDENIYTLLSQTLMGLVRQFLTDDKKYRILFNLRNGVIYAGDPLSEGDFQAIREKFHNPVASLIDPVKLTKIDSQGCSFGFLENRVLEKEDLKKIVKERFSDLMYIGAKEFFNKEGTDKGKYVASIVQELREAYDLPVKFNIDRENQKIKCYSREEWEILDEEQQQWLYAIGLQKIKFLSLKENQSWKKEWETLRSSEERFLNGNFSIQLEDQIIRLETPKALFQYFEPLKKTDRTIGAILSVCERRNQEDLEELIECLEDEILSFFNQPKETSNEETKPPPAEGVKPLPGSSKSMETSEVSATERFVDLYLNGNFIKDYTKIELDFNRVPEKGIMCVVCGNIATIDYKDAQSFGIKARGFSNKTLNTLSNDTHKICDLCNMEMTLRKTLFPQSKGSSTCIYVDVGDYFVQVDKRLLLHNLQEAKGISFEEHETFEYTLTLEKIDIPFKSYHNLLFYDLANSVEKNYNFLVKFLKIIQQTGFKIYALDIMTPYHAQKEMFVFDNCMPFIQELGWNRIRIDQIEVVLEELDLLSNLWGRQESSLLLSYAQDRKYLFSFYYYLDEEDRNKIHRRLCRFIQKRKEDFAMSTMDNLTDLAVKATWGFGSTSEETWMIRDALDILKNGHKEGKDRDTVIEQIAGALYKRLKQDNRNVDTELLLNFSKGVYDDLFVKEWNKRIPQPGRLKNWIYQFAFLYHNKSLEAIQKSRIRKEIQKLEKEGKEVKEENLRNALSKDDKIKNYIEDYLQLFREEFK